MSRGNGMNLMVNRKPIAVFAAVVFLMPLTQAGEGWYATFEEARDAANDSGIPLLIHFHASWCGPCRQMEQQVLSQPDVQQQLRKGLAAVEVDVSLHPDIAKQYGATTVPRDVIVIPGEAPRTLNVGFKSRAGYLTLLKGVAAKPKEQFVTRQKIIGLEGFCPVQLMKNRQWVSGREDLTEIHRGITYYLSSEDARKEFRTTPQDYSPQNLGCDPVVLFSDQQAVTGKIKFGAFFDSELYLFQSVENRTAFKSNPLKYTRIRHAIKVDDLAGQRFN